MHDQFRWGKGVPVDVFVMADGEPEDRHVTKTGGLPYRPANDDWPTNASGTPLLFIGQVNFNDSLDVIGELPGEILLVFADWVEPGYIEDLTFEWCSRTSKRLVSANEVPEQNGLFKPSYGYRCRTVSYPDAEAVFGDNDYLECRGKEVDSVFHLLQYQATQIGGAPFIIQPDEDPPPVACYV